YSIKGAIKWHHKDSRGSKPRAKAGAIVTCAAIYHIWRSRNAQYFDGKIANVDQTAAMVTKNVYQVLHRLYPDGGQ
ncbi:hypothetical protein ABN262_23550, partial [Citrobacter youngae]|uniref:hypothetical protein n=1 Tax=Citrobacter youngae TaxID=133448 RepID=UPI0032DBA32F